ncbi:MAG: hypothetical protein IJT91_04740 [Clostridia bacterium]|nr:hypothetical protein [Clostridia bacterium]
MKAELNYAFRKRMLQIHKPGRRDAALLPKDGQTVIDKSWTIIIHDRNDRVLYNAARDLQDYFFVSMEESLGFDCADSVNGKAIEYTVDPSLPDNSYRFTVGADRITLCGQNSRAAAQAGYHLEDMLNMARAPYIDVQSSIRTHIYSPRMIHSGFGLDMFPNEHISAIAHQGINTLLVFVEDIDITPHGYEDFNDLIYRAEGYGLDVYVYSYMRSRIHPDDEGAEEFYEGLYGKLFERCPGFKGIVFVGESCEFPSRDPHTTGIPRLDNLDGNGEPIVKGKPSPGWWPCCDFPQWIRMIQKIIRAKNPDCDIVFWTYNWGYVEAKYRLELLRNIPTDVSLLVTFEMFEDVIREGVANRTVDYTLFFEGPGQYFVSEARLAKERGIRLYAMTNTGGLTWDIGTIPYEPAPYQWMNRYKAMREMHDEYGLCGTMDSHHYGFYPSFVSELAKESFTDAAPDPDAPDAFPGKPTDEEYLRMLAVRDFGENNADKVLEAYKMFSEGIRCLVSTNEDQYGPFRVGPSYPLLLNKNLDAVFPSAPFTHHSGNMICNPVYQYDLSTDKQMQKINYEIKCHSKTSDLFAKGADILEGCTDGLDALRKEEAQRLIGLCRFISNSARTTVNTKRWKIGKTALENETDPDKIAALKAEMISIGEAEIANAEATIPLVEADSRLGFEPSMEYMCDKLHLDWKLDLTKQAVEELK